MVVRLYRTGLSSALLSDRLFWGMFGSGFSLPSVTSGFGIAGEGVRSALGLMMFIVRCSKREHWVAQVCNLCDC